MFDLIKDNPILFVLLFLAIVTPSFFVGAVQVVFYLIAALVLLFLILGIWFRYKIRKMQRDMENQAGGGSQQGFQGGFYNFGGRTNARQTKAENDVNIYQQAGSGEKRVSDNVGDYVDFEEVKEKH